ncbi:hypothetical protein T261_7422 [Streptomyces lydicus]|nr:hypothetical protein T261_7422 [Streptomyces lydicus]
MDARLRRIAAKLATVRDLLGRTHSIREESHRVLLGPPMPESRVVAFEEQYGIRLPPCYRSFLTTIGNGGIGPDHGLLHLDDWDYVVLGAPIRPDHLSTPFPLSPTDPAPGPDWYHAFGPAWLDDDDAEPYPGTIALTTRGCSLYTLLVVTGPARGRVVDVNLEFDVDAPSFTHDTDFLAWYERWLDQTGNGMHSAALDVALRDDEPPMAAILRDSPKPELREVAAQGLGRAPILTPAVRSLLGAAAVGDPAPEVRRTAVIMLGRRPTPADDDVLVRALTDASADVRESALQALAGRGSAWHVQARGSA